MAKELDMPEGTMEVRYVLETPLQEPPGERTALLGDETPAKTLVRIDLDEHLHFHFVRQAPGREPADAAVDGSPLVGASHLDFWCTWDPRHMAIHVVDPDQPKRMVSGSIGDPPTD